MNADTRIYLDHAATTPVDKRVLKAMLPFFTKTFGNSASMHSFGLEAEKALDEAREKLAQALSCTKEEVFFTSGGTESDNLAILGTVRRFKREGKGKHIITTQIEHHAVLHAIQHLERKEGFSVTYLPVSKDGFVSVSSVENAITPETILISIMHANNEIGSIQPIKQIGELARRKSILFHTDAVQTFGKLSTNVNDLNVDLLSASSHKLYGPKGVGLLFVRKGTPIESINFGGGHERGLRSGTENISGIVGFAEASRLAQENLEKEAEREKRLRDKLIHGVLKVEGSWLNGSRENRLPNNANFGFDFIEGEGIVLYLSDRGIAASTGSACSSHDLKPSHVLTAIGLPPEKAHSSLRLTLGRSTKPKHVSYTIEKIIEVVAKLRELSPLKKGVEFKTSAGWKEDEHEHGVECKH
ncbi:cysteine desulfurase [Candidatus Micrarchaeota archaeon]|nr:cysteine desulfurase [Candidatus Micrarchaeota archaeon]